MKYLAIVEKLHTASKGLIMLVALVEQPGWAKRSFSYLFLHACFLYVHENSECVSILERFKILIGKIRLQ